MANRIRTGDPCGFNKGCSSNFCEGSRVWQTPEEGWRTYRPKHCGNNNKDEDNSLKTVNDKNITVLFSNRIFQSLVLGIMWVLRCKSMELESLRCMMAYEKSESTRSNFGKFIYQFQPKTKTLIRKLDRILIKLDWQNVYILFNQTCLNERLLPNYTHIHIHIHTHKQQAVFMSTVCVF